MYVCTDRGHSSDRRREIETALAAGGLVIIAGGTKYTYFGLPGTGPADCYAVRVSKRTLRVVRRIRLTSIEDMTIGTEVYFGKITDEKATAYAARMVATRFGTDRGAVSL